jgi:hypothetical protein
MAMSKQRINSIAELSIVPSLAKFSCMLLKFWCDYN